MPPLDLSVMRPPETEVLPFRVFRDLAVVLIVAGLFAGSLWGTDDAWPFAPFRMFARGTTGDVHVLALEADLSDGRTVRMDYEKFHLRRAEVEGQILRFTARPEMVGDLMDAYNRRSRGRKIVALRVLSRRAPISDDRLVRGNSRKREGRGPPPGIHWKVKVIAEWPPR